MTRKDRQWQRQVPEAEGDEEETLVGQHLSQASPGREAQGSSFVPLSAREAGV